MTSARLIESVVEEATLAWLEGAGWQMAHGAVIAAGVPATERADDGRVALAQRLRDALLPQLIFGAQRLPSALRHRPAQRGVKGAEQTVGRHP